jgi:peptidyl-prolyl cis-trans isomerase C
MNKTVLSLSLIVLSLPAVEVAAQSAPAAVGSADRVVATVNGEVITKAKLDLLWNRIGERTRVQYEKNGGGKAGFLENYVGKRMLLQEAQQNGFDQKPGVQAELEAAKESALFDLYVRDVIASSVVTDSDVRAFYNDNKGQFSTPERARVRQIFVSTANRMPSDAKTRLSQIMTQLHPEQVANPNTFPEKFAEYAQKLSEDKVNGDLGWVVKGSLDDELDNAIFGMPKQRMSGIIETPDGVRLVLVEDKEPASVEPFEKVSAGIREFLVAQNAQKVVAEVNKRTAQLRAKGKVQVFKENIE